MEINLGKDNFEKEVINAQLPVLVDFWASWCGPCQKFAPHIEGFAKEYEGKIKVCKLNIEQASDIATQYTVMSIPTIMLFKEGKVMEKRVGVLSMEDLKEFVQPYL